MTRHRGSTSESRFDPYHTSRQVISTSNAPILLNEVIDGKDIPRTSGQWYTEDNVLRVLYVLRVNPLTICRLVAQLLYSVLTDKVTL